MAHHTGLQLGLDLGLPRPLAARLAARRTPERIQDFVNDLPWNHEPDGPTARSVVETLRVGQAHCIEAALVAACGLWMSGHPPFLVDLGAARGDVDHVIAVFRRDGCWGAISKSNSPYLRYRDPIHRTLRELAISFFSQYVKGRRKTLRSYSVAVDLRRHEPALWVTRRGFCQEIVDAMTGARHHPILPPRTTVPLRPIDEIEQRGSQLKEYPQPATRPR